MRRSSQRRGKDMSNEAWEQRLEKHDHMLVAKMREKIREETARIHPDTTSSWLNTYKTNLRAAEGRLAKRGIAATSVSPRAIDRMELAPARTGRLARGEIDTAPEPEPGSVAARILRAGARARGELKEQESTGPAPDSVAARILRAGARARGELKEQEQEPTGLAAEILAAGRKRRGEI
jgi:hypothetical protein